MYHVADAPPGVQHGQLVLLGVLESIVDTRRKRPLDIFMLRAVRPQGMLVRSATKTGSAAHPRLATHVMLKLYMLVSETEYESSRGLEIDLNDTIQSRAIEVMMLPWIVSTSAPDKRQPGGAQREVPVIY